MRILGADDQALSWPPHGSDKSSSLILASDHDPLRAAPDKKGRTPAGTAGEVVQSLEANHDLTPTAQGERERDQGQRPLPPSGSRPHRQARLQLHDNRVEA
jgi:hypothetical protein